MTTWKAIHEGCMSLKLILSFTMHFLCVSYRLCCSSVQTVPAADQTDETFCRWILKRKRPKVSVVSQIVNGLYWWRENWVHARFLSVWGGTKKISPWFEWLKGGKIGKLKVVYSVHWTTRKTLFLFWLEKNWINTSKVTWLYVKCYLYNFADFVRLVMKSSLLLN